MQLARRAPEFGRLGVRIFGLAVDEGAEMQQLQKELGDSVTLLSDPAGTAVRALGLLDPDPFPARLTARSATLFFDRDGRLAWAFYPEAYRSRPAPGTVLAAIRRRD